MKSHIVAAVCLSASLAQAAPAYLECGLTNGQKVVTWNVALDEASATVSYTIPELGVAAQWPAVFTPGKVVFGSMEINRVDLSFKRTTAVIKVKTDFGQCKLAETPKRAF